MPNKKPRTKTKRKHRFTRQLATYEQSTRAKITARSDVYQSSGSGVAYQVSALMEFPISFNVAGNYASASIYSLSFDRLNAVYDEYKVHSLSVDYMTTVNCNGYDQIGGVSGSAPPANVLNPYIYVEKDYDDDAVITSETRALIKGKPHSINKYWHVKMRNSKTRLNKWLNTSNIASMAAIPVAGGTINDDIPKRSAMKLFIPNVVNNTFLGSFFFTWDITYHSLRTN